MSSTTLQVEGLDEVITNILKLAAASMYKGTRCCLKRRTLPRLGLHQAGTARLRMEAYASVPRNRTGALQARSL